MVAINFQEKFAEKVQLGEKTQTIRRKNRFKVGDTLQLYTGQRTNQCRKLGEGIVTAVIKISIREDDIVFFGDLEYWNDMSLDYFARMDGFKDFDEMKRWFKKVYKKLPFDGWLVQWRFLDESTKR